MRNTAIILALCATLAACGKAEQAVQPLEITGDTVCALDGMTLADYPGPKAQIHFDRGAPDFFCDTKEMFSIYLRPEQKRRVVALYTQDMGRADWGNPKGEWMDAKTAYYVHGSEKLGAMGPTLAAFARREDAEAFANQHGGKVLRFEQVTLDMVDLHGGVQHDRH